MTRIPEFTTERLRLRAPCLSDFEAWAEFFASDRSRHEGGPLPRDKAYCLWAADVALWHLRGYGPFGVEDHATGDHLGEVGIYQRDDYPGPELGWFVRPEAEGRGIAFEAARAVLGWAATKPDLKSLTTIVEAANARSIALSQRLGGVIDPNLPGIDAGDVVLNYPESAAA
jgi:RimJ/RimL family protein N-acetyltransferase